MRNIYCYPLNSAFSTPLSISNHYEVAHSFLKGTIKSNWKEIFKSAQHKEIVFVSYVVRHHLLEPYQMFIFGPKFILALAITIDKQVLGGLNNLLKKTDCF